MFGVNKSRIIPVGWLEGRPRRQPHQIDTVILHRIGSAKGRRPATCKGWWPHDPPHPIGENAVEIATWFKEHPEALGTPLMPYTFVIPRDGTIEQAVWLVTKTPHALRWNSRAIGVALVGDFRYEDPTSEQVDAAAALIVRLNDTLRRTLAIHGHTMWHPAPRETTKHVEKQCPGPRFEQAYKEILDQVRACSAIHLGA